MSALKGIFNNWQEGEEFAIEDTERWSLLNIGYGDFVELSLAWTDWSPSSEATVGFLVTGRTVTADGGMALRARFVGSTDHTLSKSLSSQFNRREGFVHLCISRPCTEAEESFLRTTKVKVYSREGFNPPYFTSSHKRQVAKWLGEIEEVETVHEDGARETDEGRADRTILPDFGARVGGAREEDVVRQEDLGGRGSLIAAPKSRGKRPGALRSGSAAPGRARARGKGIAGIGGAGGDSLPAEAPGSRTEVRSEERHRGVREEVDDLQLGSEKEREEMSTAELKKKLETVRLKLGGAPRPSIAELKRLPAEDDGEDLQLEGELSSGFAEAAKGLTSGTSLKRRIALEDTRGTSTRDVSEQLVRQAQHLAAGKNKKTDEEKASSHAKGGEREELLALLNQVAKRSKRERKDEREPPRKSGESGHSKKKKKKRKKKDGKKNRKRKLVNGVLMSTSASSSSSEESSATSRSLTEEQFEAPLRKRSKAAPGSVLKLLVQKAQDALDQSALVEMTPGAATPITDGVKLTTYYQLHIKPHYAQHKGPMRDIALMARVLDTIRAGAIGRGCDMLAGHFLAAHQALMDQSWVQAKYLEVIEPEEQNATSAAILLEARKHAKTSLKAETFEAWLPGKGWQRPWQASGKGSWQADKGKGKQKKGGKGKERGSWQERDGKGKNKWKESHDKGEKEKE